MARQITLQPILSEVPAFDEESGDLGVVIEAPKGSPNKYRYDPRYDAWALATVLPEGMAFPYDFGFIPSTVGDDGDPLDVLVLMDAPVIPGCVIRGSHHRRGQSEAKGKERWMDAQ